MKRFWRYLQFWSVLLFAGAALCLVLWWLRQMSNKS